MLRERGRDLGKGTFYPGGSASLQSTLASHVETVERRAGKFKLPTTDEAAIIFSNITLIVTLITSLSCERHTDQYLCDAVIECAQSSNLIDDTCAKV